jgi:WD40 repeat protein
MDVKFSPKYNMLSVGQITGDIRVYSYDESKMDNLITFDHHKESVRTIDYNPGGNILYAGSKDKSISVISNGRVEGVLK